jgi:hypothetical protein
MKAQVTTAHILAKINELGVNRIHDLYWEASIIGWDTILFYDASEDTIGAVAFTSSTRWNDQCEDIYLCCLDNFRYDNLFNHWDEIFTEDELEAWDQDNETAEEFAKRMGIDLVNDRYFDASLFWFEDGWDDLIDTIESNLSDEEV